MKLILIANYWALAIPISTESPKILPAIGRNETFGNIEQPLKTSSQENLGTHLNSHPTASIPDIPDLIESNIPTKNETIPRLLNVAVKNSTTAAPAEKSENFNLIGKLEICTSPGQPDCLENSCSSDSVCGNGLTCTNNQCFYAESSDASSEVQVVTKRVSLALMLSIIIPILIVLVILCVCCKCLC